MVTQVLRRRRRRKRRWFCWIASDVALPARLAPTKAYQQQQFIEGLRARDRWCRTRLRIRGPNPTSPIWVTEFSEPSPCRFLRRALTQSLSAFATTRFGVLYGGRGFTRHERVRVCVRARLQLGRTRLRIRRALEAPWGFAFLRRSEARVFGHGLRGIAYRL